MMDWVVFLFVLFFFVCFLFFFFQAEDGIRDHCVTGVQTCALPIYLRLIWARYGPLLSKQPMIPLYSTLVGILQYSFICGVQFNRVGNFVYSIERSSFRVYMKRDNRHTKQTVAHCRPQVDISSI